MNTEITMETTMTSNKTPLQSLRKYCLWCCNNQKEEVKLCPVTDCPLHALRFGHKKNVNGDKPSVTKSIHLKCIDCSGHSINDVKDCWAIKCDLYPYRMGKNPNRTGIGGNPNALHRYKENQKKANSHEDLEGDQSYPTQGIDNI
jgi:hypothetical protein